MTSKNTFFNTKHKCRMLAQIMPQMWSNVTFMMTIMNWERFRLFQQAFKDFFFFNHYEQVSLTTLALNKCVISVTSSNASVRSYKLEKEAFRVEKHSKE